MAMNEAECDDMIESVQKNKVKLQIGFMRRFDDRFMAAKQQIDSGVIGEVVMVRSVTYGPSVWPSLRIWVAAFVNCVSAGIRISARGIKRWVSI